MMKYFTIDNQTTPEGISSQYRALCKKLHPDSGGPEASHEAFIEMREEYGNCLHALARSSRATGHTDSYQEYTDLIKDLIKDPRFMAFVMLTGAAIAKLLSKKVN